MSNRHFLPEDFWNKFAAEYWEKKVGLFPGILSADIASPGDVLQCLKRAGAQYRECASPLSVRLYRGNGMIQSDISALLAGEEDQRLDGYGQRLAQAFAGDDFLLAMNHAQFFDFELWRRARLFLAPLFERIGLPPDNADVDFFIGHYARTPEAVHKDSASNFMMVVAGRKKMRFWPSEAFTDNACYRDLHHVRDAELPSRQAQCIEVDAGPGDLVYWPSSAWHIGESPEGFSVSLNIPLYVEASAADFLNTVFRTALAQVEEDARDMSGLGEPQGELPSGIRGLLSDHGTPESRALLTSIAEELWLQRASASGFRVVPSPLDVQGALATSLRSDPDFPLLWKVSEESILCAGNGHSLRVADSRPVRRLLEVITSEHSLKVEDWVAQAAAEEDTPALREGLKELIREFVSWRVLVADGSPA